MAHLDTHARPGLSDENSSTDIRLTEFSRSAFDDHGQHTPDEDDSEFDDDSGDELFRNQAGRDVIKPVIRGPKYTTAEENRVRQKLDRHLVTFLAVLYMLSFMDRSNLGNAKIAGMSRDLRLSSDQYEWLLTAFYITYIAFEWMTLLYRVVPPHVYIALCVFSWGFIASVQAVATSFSMMVFLRAVLGISEAAFGPGVPFYMSFFYKREELALRTGLFISAAPLATSFASSLAWLITKFSESSAIAPWRVLFIAEGFPSVVVAVIAWYTIPDGPESAQFLTHSERNIAKARLQYYGNKNITHHSKLSWKEIGKTLMDPKCYLTAMMFFSCNVAFSSLPVFLPTIINDMGYSTLASQALSAPPYLIAFIFVIFIAFLSDRLQSRGLILVGTSLLSCLGYSICAFAGWRRWGFFWRYFGVYLASAGFFSSITIIITWTLNNQRSDSGKGTGMAILNIIGQCGPLLGTRLYPAVDGPYYVRGMTFCAGFMLFVALLATILRFVLGAANRSIKKSRVPAHVSGEDLHRSDNFFYIL
jgi:MFS family permease